MLTLGQPMPAHEHTRRWPVLLVLTALAPPAAAADELTLDLVHTPFTLARLAS